jgi:lipopolysaccharide export system permease protein
VTGPFLRQYLFGILPRYVLGQVLRAFLLALMTLTCIIVLFMVMAEATRQGLPPGAILKLVPYIVPGTLPYTIPVALLFAVSVVYGRLGGDNEIVAVKSSGCDIWTVLAPSLVLATIMSMVLIGLSGVIIPKSNYAFKSALFKDAEETFYLVLKREREFNHPRWPVFIGVKDVDMEHRTLIGPTFKHRTPGSTEANRFDTVVQADKAIVTFDQTRRVVNMKMTRPVLQSSGRFSAAPYLEIDYPMPDASGMLSPDKRVQEMTDPEIAREHVKILKSLATERTRNAVAAGLWIAAGRMDRVHWPDVGNAYRNDLRWKRQSHELQTESHTRMALAFGAIGFVLLGSPVGIRYARRDFLSAFITCFVPIIVLYYPLVLAGINMGKEGIVGPWIVWSGDLALFLLASLVALPPVMKH